MNDVLRSLVALGLIGLGLAFAALTVGAFGQLNPSSPIPILSDIEWAVTSTARFLAEREPLAAQRGFAYMGFTLVFTSLAALLLASPKSETVPRPGRPAAPGSRGV